MHFKYIEDIFRNHSVALRSGIINFGVKTDDSVKNMYHMLFYNRKEFTEFIEAFTRHYTKKPSKEDNAKMLHSLLSEKLARAYKEPLDSHIKWLFEYSLFPSVDDVLTLYENKPNLNIDTLTQEVENNFRISQKDLFHFFPGLYYNPVCRVKCNVSTYRNLEIRRRRSLGNNVTKKNIPKNFKPDGTHYNDINDFMF